MLANCHVIVIFLVYDRFREIQKMDSRCMISKNYIFINNNLLYYKNWKQN